MTDYERGLLEAAAESRRRAEEYRMEANRMDLDGRFNGERGLRARASMFDEFARWCEERAGQYPGASVTLIGL